MSSPIIWGGNQISNSLQQKLQLSTGKLLANDGQKNYIAYSSFENGATTGWSLGTVGTLTNGIPTGSPTFGSGASGNLSISATSSSPLAGNYSLSLVSSAASTQGNMLASQAYALDIEDQAKVLTFKFYYSATANASNGNFSGTSSNSFGVACYDVTNSSWLPVAGNFSMTQSSGVGIATGTMQTNATTASIRFVVYNVNATSGAITLYFDDFYLGPQTAPIGPVVTDAVAYTPTIAGVGTISATNVFYRRVGDRLYVQGETTIGTTSGTTFSISVPSGLSIDFTKISATGNTQDVGNITGVGGAGTFATSSNGPFRLFTDGSTSLIYAASASSSGSYTKAAGNGPFGNNVVISFNFDVPIAGWSSNVQMSNDTDTRVVAASYYASGASQTITSAQQFNFDSALYDTHGAVTTGSGWKFTAPVSGIYTVETFLGGASGTASAAFGIYKNGTSTQTLCFSDNPSARPCSGSADIKLSAGDYIDIRSNQSTTFPNISALPITNGAACYITISRKSGPAVVAATESVNARYYSSATSISGSLATINYATKDFDSHNAYSAGTYTAPVSGKYQVNAGILVTGTIALNNQLVVEIQKNGTVVSRETVYFPATLTDGTGLISDIISCNAGDTVRIQVSTSVTGPSIVSSNFDNYFSLCRVGN